RRLLFVGIAVAVVAGILICLNDFSFSKPPLSFLLLSALIGLRAWYTRRERQFDLAIFIATLLLLASITAIKHGEFQRYKKEEKEKIATPRCEAVEEPNALAICHNSEKENVHDPARIDYFEQPPNENRELLNEHLQGTYLSGYHSRYEIIANEYNPDWTPIGN